ncbi:Carbohydrate-selective porin [Novosphingobium sp. Rr 2-17]|uniref:carbohydrate porin n=1 Tax=Novosphingobium sp. Rr 2-17 TaxID=555793 RepID=UPI0002698F19|nr:carbohydrate porin [Novosphingobium sp. Rr 2-17]EIZ78100.1 Carbohydrate-selective porin [Novosphingobium sp. Rr 2-17]
MKKSLMWRGAGPRLQILVGALMLICPTIATAQTEPDGLVTHVEVPLDNALPETLTGPASFEPMPPSGPLSEMRRSLNAAGFDLGVLFANLFQYAPSYGLTPGKTANFGAVSFTATADLEALISVPHTRLKIIETVNFPTHNADTFLFTLSNAFNPSPVVDSRTDLTRFTIQTDLLNDRLHIEGGRMGLAIDFMKRGTCGGLGCFNSTQAVSVGLPGVALASWGGRVAYDLSSTLTTQFGIIDDNETNWQNGSGWDWGRGNSQGYIAIWNLSRSSDFMRDRLPLTYEVGAFRRSASYVDPVSNTDGSSHVLNPGGTPRTYSGGTNGVYGQARKVIWRTPASDEPIFPENIAIYGGAFSVFGEGQAYPFEGFAGIDWGGFWSKNPVANVGVSVHLLRLSEERAQYEREIRLVTSGLDQRQPKNTYALEAHGRLGLGRWAIAELAADYYINPNNSVIPGPRQSDGWMLTSALIVDIGSALGLAPASR